MLTDQNILVQPTTVSTKSLAKKKKKKSKKKFFFTQQIFRWYVRRMLSFFVTTKYCPTESRWGLSNQKIFFFCTKKKKKAQDNEKEQGSRIVEGWLTKKYVKDRCRSGSRVTNPCCVHKRNVQSDGVGRTKVGETKKIFCFG